MAGIGVKLQKIFDKKSIAAHFAQSPVFSAPAG